MGKLSIATFVCQQWATVPPVMIADLTGKTVVIVGANTGIGLEAALHFASMKPARLIIGARNEQKGLAAVEVIREKTGHANIECWLIDLCNFASVVAFAERFDKEGVSVDILIANAGVAVTQYHTTSNGWEQTLQTNHLATALLSFLLTPNLIRTAEKNVTTSRLVIVCSEVHFWSSFSDEVISAPNILAKLNEKSYFTKVSGESRYEESKLLNVLFTRAYAEHLPESTPLIPSCTNPGFCVSELRRSLSTGRKLFAMALEKILGRTAEEGARQLIYSALAPDDKDAKWRMRGGYVSTAEVVEPSDFVLSLTGAEAQRRIWEETIEILSKDAPQVTDIIRQYFTA